MMYSGCWVPSLPGFLLLLLFPGVVGWTSSLAIPRRQHSSFRGTTNLKSTPRPSSTLGRIDGSLDPLLTNLLVQEPSSSSSSILHFGGSITAASNGLSVWRSVLCKGRLPCIETDFDGTIWPPEPLFSRLCAIMVDLQMPRFVLRHPETVSAILLTVLRLVQEFHKAAAEMEKESEYIQDDHTNTEDMLPSAGVSGQQQLFKGGDEDELEVLAEDIASGLMDEWGGVVGGVHALDSLFGANHGLLDINPDDDDADVGGFGLHDGVWKHSGWTVLPGLQKQLASMNELRGLMKSIGRRPTAEKSDAIHKFAPRRVNPEGGLGASWDPTMRNSVSGLTLSSSLSEMLPSEAVLLRGSSPALRRLFLAKKVEAKLFSYELSGWIDAPSFPRSPHARVLSRMPSGPGGPLVVLLDTSWSMSGMRETLSKAVTLACVMAAHKQRRDCQVVAFSAKNGVMETGTLKADADGVRRLLDFLSYSFGGGTDVTGALKHAMATLGSDKMSAADLLLVTDGEIPDPPVSDEMMQDLARLKRRTGMQIHGLLVGKSESKPLSKLCTKTHDFLIGYDTLGLEATSLLGGGSTRRPAFSSLSAHRVAEGPLAARRTPYDFFRRTSSRTRTGRYSRLTLCARNSMYSGEDEQMGTKRRKQSRRSRKRWSDFDDDDDAYDYRDEQDYDSGDESEPDTVGASGPDRPPETNYNARVEESLNSLRSKVAGDLQELAWDPNELDDEKNAAGSCWSYRADLKAAVDRVGEGLVEREAESRLVVLGMAAREHVLLLGPPGTGKSVLGRRLSKICGGSFFQRLLTRFTTPDEIFGPLSLRSLENDEYRRCTTGFLPTASVAFLDEIFKANSAILNTLLTILNERQFDNGAGSRESCDIRCVLAASNELPESDELDALWDRFLLRKEVVPVSDEGIMRVLTMPTPGFSPCVDGPDGSDTEKCDVLFTDGLDKVVDALSSAANEVHMSTDAAALVRDLRNFMREELDEEVSDRRLVKAARLLKISAASHGRKRVDQIDCLLLQHVAWRVPEQRSAIQEWLWGHLTPGGETPSTAVAPFRVLLDGLRREAALQLRKTAGDISGDFGAREPELAAIQSLRVEASNVADILQQRSADLNRHKELLRRSTDHLWLEPDEANAVQQLLLPKTEETLKEIDKALVDARMLESVLSEESQLDNDLRLSVLDLLWEEEPEADRVFSEDELSMGMKEAKAKYDGDIFRAWKRARKKATKKR